MKKNRPGFRAFVICDSTGKQIPGLFKYRSKAVKNILSADGSYQYELKPLLPPKQLPLFPSSVQSFRNGRNFIGVSVLVWGRG